MTLTKTKKITATLQSLLAEDFRAGKARAAGDDWRNEPWRKHFSIPAQDLIQIQRAFVGEELGREIVRACFMMRPHAIKIDTRTVEKVLQDLS